MRTKTFSAKRLLSLLLTVAMFATMILPTSVFAAITAPTAVATVIESAPGTQIKTITISFVEEVVLDPSAVLDTDISVAGKTFGSSTMVLDPATQKDLVITLKDDADVAVGEMITFANDKIINANDNTDFFNGDIEITGSLTCATIDYSGIIPVDAAIEVAGYATAPTSVGTGIFNYTLTKDNYVTKTGSFVIEQDDLGETVTVTDTMEKNAANYTALDAAILSASAYDADDYTATSFAVLTTALTNANAVDRNLKFDEQSTIDDLKSAIDAAIIGLVSKRTVDFMAVGVTDDVNANYGKATKVVIVFDEPIDAAASAVLDNLSIKDKVSSATWADAENTVLSLTLNADANLSNSTSITYTANDAVKTKLLPAVVDTKTVVALGNFAGSANLVTATEMAATIVKGSDMPGVVNGDKIVIVFNAPVKDNPTTIAVNGMTATPVSGTNNTIYEIVLNGSESVDDTTTLTYETMSTTLGGSFGTAVAPKVMKVVAIDNDGTANTEGDQIVISFDRPTNGVTIPSSALKTVVTKAGQGFGEDAVATWNTPKNTELTITIGQEATIKDDVIFNLGSLGIKDEFDVAEYVGESLSVEGSFGTTIAPKITRAIAFTQNNQHKIRVFFNTLVKPKVGLTVYVDNFNEGASVGAWTHNGISYYDIILGNEHQEFVTNTYDVLFDGVLVDAETEKTEVVDLRAKIQGGFEQDIEPEILSLTAYSKDGSGIAKAGDEVILVLNSEATNVTTALGNFTKVDSVTWKYVLVADEEISISQNVLFTINALGKTFTRTANIVGSFGYLVEPKLLSATAYSKDGSGVAKAQDEIVLVFNAPVVVSSGLYGDLANRNGQTDVADTVWKITNLNTSNVAIGTTVTFNVLSVSTGKSYTRDITLGGTFGKVVEPHILSVTAVSQNGYGVPKAGDNIIVVFDTKVNVKVNGTYTAEADNVYTYTLADDGEYDVNDLFEVTVKVPATGIEYTLSDNIGGSFGNVQENKIISALLYYNNNPSVKAEFIDVVFSAETNGNNGLTTTPSVVETIRTNNTKLDVVSAEFIDNYTFRIKLGNGSTIVEGDEISLEGINITDKNTGAVIDVVDLRSAVKGSLIPVVQTAVVVDNIVTITFSSRTNGAGIDVIENQKALYGSNVAAEWKENNTQLVITMSDDNTMAEDAYIVLNGLGLKDGFSNSYALVGQYKIDTTLLKKKTLNITSVFVKANNTENAPRADVTKGLEGDNIIVRFEDVTNKLAGDDAKANVALVGTDSFGENYTATWSDNKTIVITLGTNPVITTATQVIVKDVKFANGTGFLGEGGADQITKTLTGQFDGRTYWIVNPDKNDVNGRVRVVGTINKADITNPAVLTPYVVCQAMNSKDVVLSINAIKLADVATNDVVFDFDATNLAKIKMFVLNGDYSDATAVVSVFSETIEK